METYLLTIKFYDHMECIDTRTETVEAESADDAIDQVTGNNIIKVTAKPVKHGNQYSRPLGRVASNAR